VDQVGGLESVGEGHPRKIAKREHEAESVGGDVHRCQYGLLHDERVPHVDELEHVDQKHFGGDAVVDVELLRRHGEVEDDPAN